MFEIPPLATKNLFEDTDGLRRPPPSKGGATRNPSVTSRCGTLRPSIYADVRCIDDVIAIEGQTLFEGLKAFECQDGHVRYFHPFNANHQRMALGCDRLAMPHVPVDMFADAVGTAVRENINYVPPFGGGAMYIRPFIFGSGAKLGTFVTSTHPYPHPHPHTRTPAHPHTLYIVAPNRHNERATPLSKTSPMDRAGL